jgi:hypothetical protein
MIISTGTCSHGILEMNVMIFEKYQDKRIDFSPKGSKHFIDYIGWAINRKYEHGDPSYYEMIKQYLLEEEVMTKDRVEVHY